MQLKPVRSLRVSLPGFKSLAGDHEKVTSLQVSPFSPIKWRTPRGNVARLKRDHAYEC